MKKNSSMLIGLVVIVIVVVGGYMIFHKSSKTTTSTNAYGTTTPAATTPAATSGSVVQTKTSSSVGTYLANSNGDALYTYGADKTGVSNCSGSCIANWPIYKPGPTTSLPTNVTVITRSDGSSQYAYKGLPLYTFSGDSAGQVTGDGVSDFHVAKP